MTDRELMQMVLDALEKIGMGGDPRWADDVMPALRARLAQPEPEPVTMVISKTGDSSVTMSWWHEPALPVGTSLYTTPPQREWQDLTDDESDEIWGECLGVFDCLRMTQAKLKEKNG